MLRLKNIPRRNKMKITPKFIGFIFKKKETTKNIIHTPTPPVSSASNQPALTQLEKDMEEFKEKKSNNFAGISITEESNIRKSFNKKYTQEGLNFLINRLKTLPMAKSKSEALKLINESLTDLNRTFPLDWSLSQQNIRKVGREIVIPLLAHKVIIHSNGAYKIIDLRTSQYIFSKKSQHNYGVDYFISKKKSTQPFNKLLKIIKKISTYNFTA